MDLRTGKVVGSVGGFGGGGFGANGGAHLGCLAYYDGMIYGSLEYKQPGKKFFVCAFDEDVITTTGMSVDDISEGVYGLLLREPTEDFRDPLDDTAYSEADGFAKIGSSKGHKFACSGIVGVTFGTMPGDTSGKMYMMVAYGVYGTSAAEWQARYDNDYNVIQCYDLSEMEIGDSAMRRFTYARGVDNSGDIAGGEYLEAVDTLYAWTGNTNYGVQNLEWDKDTGDLVMFTYGATKPYNRGSLFIIDGSVAPVVKTLEVGQNNTNPDEAIQVNSYINYRLTASQNDNCLVLPIQSVRTVGMENGEMATVVYIRSDSRPDNAIEVPFADEEIPDGFWPVPVEIGIQDNYNVEIKSGVEEGTEVFTQILSSNVWG